MNEFKKALENKTDHQTCSFLVTKEERDYLYNISEINGFRSYSDFFRSMILTGISQSNLKTASGIQPKQKKLDFSEKKINTKETK